MIFIQMSLFSFRKPSTTDISIQNKMEEKLKDFASKAGKGGMPGAPKGLGLGVKLLAAGAAAVYGVQQSMYTGNSIMKKYSLF